MHVLNWLLPAVFDNTFSGPRKALWCFYALTALTLWRSWHHLTALDGGARSIATVPLDSYPAGAAATVIGVFALWGLSQVIAGLSYLMAAIRYRLMIPLFYLLMVVEYAVRMLIGGFKPIETADTAPGAVGNLPLMTLALVILVLRLISRKSN